MVRKGRVGSIIEGLHDILVSRRGTKCREWRVAAMLAGKKLLSVEGGETIFQRGMEAYRKEGSLGASG